MKKKPTRFERVVMKAFEKQMVFPSVVVTLLASEHRAVRRKVKGMEWLNPSNEFQRGQTYLVKELLAWLRERAR